MCIVISSTVYGTRTFAALVKMVPGSKMFPAISVMILVAMVTLSVVSDGNAFSDGTRRMFRYEHLKYPSQYLMVLHPQCKVP